VRLEGLGLSKKFNDLIWKQTRDLAACSIVPPETTLDHALTNMMKELANGLRNFTKRSKQNGRNLRSVVAEKKM
jgi:hypothetical protein